MRCTTFVLVLVTALTLSVSVGALGSSASITPQGVGATGKLTPIQWYHTPATQCVTNHEGWWNTYDRGYAGRFQMDYNFERETSYGLRAQVRYGRANNWPRIVQIRHAYEVWLYAGWSRWPTYARFCVGLWPSGPHL